MKGRDLQGETEEEYRQLSPERAGRLPKVTQRLSPTTPWIPHFGFHGTRLQLHTAQRSLKWETLPTDGKGSSPPPVLAGLFAPAPGAQRGWWLSLRALPGTAHCIAYPGDTGHLRERRADGQRGKLELVLESSLPFPIPVSFREGPSRDRPGTE